MTYAALNLVFLLGALVRVAAFIIVTRSYPIRGAALTLAGLFALTAVFDNVIVGLGIVTYDSAKLLGPRIGFAPIEDFYYPLVAALLVPVFWSGRTRPADRGIRG